MKRRSPTGPKIEIDAIRKRALKAILPLRPADPQIRMADRRTAAGNGLPPYYIVYFLLVDLLGFRCFGPGDKVAWSVPVELDGRAFMIEHRKMGLGVFAADLAKDEPVAEEVVRLVCTASKVAKPYFDWLAEQAVTNSKLNVVNCSAQLFERSQYFCDSYTNPR